LEKAVKNFHSSPLSFWISSKPASARDIPVIRPKKLMAIVEIVFYLWKTKTISEPYKSLGKDFRCLGDIRSL